jgi:DNA-binding transcriptional MerR regulator
MRVGELARQVGTTTDTIRFYERSGWLPRVSRRENAYREYADGDVEHLRLLIDLRRLEVPLDDASRIAAWCHSGHCPETSAALPDLIAARRHEVADRIGRLRALDAQLASLAGHLGQTSRGSLPLLDAGGPCCTAAGAVVTASEGGCSCCAVPDGELG